MSNYHRLEEKEISLILGGYGGTGGSSCAQTGSSCGCDGTCTCSCPPPQPPPKKQ